MSPTNRVDLPFVDDFLPDFDVGSQHEIEVAAPADVVYDAARRLDMSSSATVRLLFRLRGMPSSALTAEGLARIRFKPILEDAPRGFVLGIVGQFWTMKGRLLDFDPNAFRELEREGFAKAIWSFDVTALSPQSAILRTVTRVSCSDDASRRRFKLYWALVGPFSSLIRNRILAMVRKSAERSQSGESV